VRSIERPPTENPVWQSRRLGFRSPTRRRGSPYSAPKPEHPGLFLNRFEHSATGQQQERPGDGFLDFALSPPAHRSGRAWVWRTALWHDTLAVRCGKAIPLGWPTGKLTLPRKRFKPAADLRATSTAEESCARIAQSAFGERICGNRDSSRQLRSRSPMDAGRRGKRNNPWPPSTRLCPGYEMPKASPWRPLASATDNS